MFRSVRVRDYMITDVVTIGPDTEILQAVHTLVENDISGAPVTDENGRLIGMLTERDCMPVIVGAGYYEEYGGRVSQFMSGEVEAIAPDNSILDVARRFLNKPYRRYPVVEGGRVVGQISRRDVIRVLQELW